MHKGKSLVEQLFDGEIYAAEQFNPYESKDYKKELKDVRKVEEIFTSSRTFLGTPTARALNF